MWETGWTKRKYDYSHKKSDIILPILLWKIFKNCTPTLSYCLSIATTR